MQFINFITPTLLDREFLRLPGVSIKLHDNAIGQFGTGIKHAICVSLRDGLPLFIFQKRDGHVFRGHFGTRVTTLRGQQVELVSFFEKNLTTGEDCPEFELPYAVNMSRAWAGWMAVREFYSNTLDENGEIIIEQTASLDSIAQCMDEGTTHISLGIHQSVMDDCKRNILFMGSGERLYKSKDFDVITPDDAKASGYYIRGMRVWDRRLENIIVNFHDANFFRDHLSEERQLRHSYPAYAVLARYTRYAMSDDREDFTLPITADVVAALCRDATASAMVYEDMLPYYIFDKFNIDHRMYHESERAKAAVLIEKHMPESLRNLNDAEQKRLDSAMKHFKAMGFEYPNTTKFYFSDRGDIGTLAETRAGGRVVLFAGAFRGGPNTLLRVLLEEYTHVVLKEHDRTIGQQHAYLEMMITMYNHLSGEWV